MIRYAWHNDLASYAFNIDLIIPAKYTEVHLCSDFSVEKLKHFVIIGLRSLLSVDLDYYVALEYISILGRRIRKNADYLYSLIDRIISDTDTDADCGSIF